MMFRTKLKILQHVLAILDIDKKGNTLFLSQVTDYVIKLINTKYNIYWTLLDKPQSKLFMVDIDQIFIFQQWRHNTFIRIPTTIEADIIYKFTEEEWDIVCNE